MREWPVNSCPIDRMPGRVFLEASPQPIMLTDTDLGPEGPRITYVNPAFERMTGWHSDDIVGRTPRVLQGPETNHDIFADLYARLTSGEDWTGETVNYRRDGDPFTLSWSITPIRDGAGNTLTYMAIQEDVTDRRALEAGRRRLKGIVDQLMQAAFEGIIILDVAGRILHASRAAAEIFHCHQDDLLGQPIEAFLDQPITGDAQLHAMALRRSGQKFPVAVNTVEIADPETPGCALIIRDLTHLVAQCGSLERETSRLRTAHRIARMGSWDYDHTDGLIHIPEDTRKRFGLGEEMQTCTPDQFLTNVYPKDVKAVRQAFTHALSAGETYSATYRLKSRDSVLVVHAVGEIWRAPDGSVAGLAGVIQDITEWADQERRLLEALTAAEAANAAKSRFLATVSHELRTPLNAINGFSEILTQEMFGPIDNAYYKDYAGEILSSGRHLLSLIEQILDFTNVEGGDLWLDEAPVAMVSLLHQIASAYATTAARRKIAIEIQPSRLPPVHADPRLLRKAISHLLDNAIKFAPADTVVRLSLHQDEAERCIISVSDQGPGIAETQISRALSLFEQLNDHLARHHGGMGVGLHLVQAVAKGHGGELSLKRIAEGGTRASIVLPAERNIQEHVAVFDRNALYRDDVSSSILNISSRRA